MGNLKEGRSKRLASWEKSVIEFEYKGRAYREELRDLSLRDMSTLEIKNTLNMLPGKFAFWKTVESDVSLELEELQEQYDQWFAEKYMEVDSTEGKATEGKKKNIVMLNNAREYNTWHHKMHGLKDVKGKVHAITKALDMQVWTLRSIADLTKQELGALSSGHGSLADIPGDDDLDDE